MTDLEILGLQEGATEKEIRQAWIVGAMRTHPDRGGNPAAFQELKAAYDRLTNKKSCIVEYVKLQVPCPKCGGQGTARGKMTGFAASLVPCKRCKGKGKIMQKMRK